MYMVIRQGKFLDKYIKKLHRGNNGVFLVMSIKDQSMIHKPILIRGMAPDFVCLIGHSRNRIVKWTHALHVVKEPCEFCFIYHRGL